MKYVLICFLVIVGCKVTSESCQPMLPKVILLNSELKIISFTTAAKWESDLNKQSEGEYYIFSHSSKDTSANFDVNGYYFRLDSLFTLETNHYLPDGHWIFCKKVDNQIKLGWERFYRQNKIEGLSKQYNQDGHLINRSYYKDGYRVNNSTNYRNGKVTVIDFYNSNNDPYKIWPDSSITYSSNGKTLRISKTLDSNIYSFNLLAKNRIEEFSIYNILSDSVIVLFKF